LKQGSEDHRRHDVFLISKFVDADLDAGTFLAISRQVAECRWCRQLAEELRAASDLIRGSRKTAAVPSSVDRRVRDDFGARQAGWQEKVRFRGVPGVVATVAAGALLFISSSYLRPPSPQGTPVPNRSAVSRPTSPAGDTQESQPRHRTTPADHSRHVLIREIQQTPPMHSMPMHPDPI
jgi:anti-sigma factor RsiW